MSVIEKSELTIEEQQALDAYKQASDYYYQYLFEDFTLTPARFSETKQDILILTLKLMLFGRWDCYISLVTNANNDVLKECFASLGKYIVFDKVAGLLVMREWLSNRGHYADIGYWTNQSWLKMRAAQCLMGITKVTYKWLGLGVFEIVKQRLLSKR